MGADGGSIPDRRDLVRTKAKSEQTDKALLRELYFLCALSKRVLAKPVVADPLGKIYNKEAIVEWLIDKSRYGDGDTICGYVKGVKDLVTLNLTPNPTYEPPTASSTSHVPARAPFVCPLSLKEMSGVTPFIALRPCGCVFSDAAVRAVIPTLTRGVGARAVRVVKDREIDGLDGSKPVDSARDADGAKEVVCPNCGTAFDPMLPNSIMPINPTKEVQEVLLENLLTTRAAAKGAKKRKAAAVGEADAPVKAARTDMQEAKETGKERRSAASRSGTGTPTSAPTPGLAPSIARSVHDKLAEQEKKRLAAQAGMSDAVKSMFRSKTETKRGGADEFFGRTFNRYAA
ncbi:Replication termination factor 2 [Cryptotrichosporon argae]